MLVSSEVHSSRNGLASPMQDSGILKKDIKKIKIKKKRISCLEFFVKNIFVKGGFFPWENRRGRGILTYFYSPRCQSFAQGSLENGWFLKTWWMARKHPNPHYGLLKFKLTTCPSLPTAWKFSGVNDMLSVSVCSVLSPKGAGMLTSDRNKPLSPIRDQHSFDCLV